MTVEINLKPECRYPVMCAWCGRLVDWSNVKNSYGMCDECSEKFRAEASLFTRPQKLTQRKEEG